MQEAAEPGAVEGKYANFFRVGFNDVEFILEFGQEFEDTPNMHTRIVLNPVHVRPFLRLVGESMNAYEQKYGVPQSPGDDGTAPSSITC